MRLVGNPPWPLFMIVSLLFPTRWRRCLSATASPRVPLFLAFSPRWMSQPWRHCARHFSTIAFPRAAPFSSPGGLWDRRDQQYVVMDVDGTRQAASPRALPHLPTLPEPQRRLAQVAAPGYTGRKRGEVVRTRTTILQAHTHQWLGTFAGPGNGDLRGELQRAGPPWPSPMRRTISFFHPRSCSASTGGYGDTAVLNDVLAMGLGIIARSRDYARLRRKARAGGAFTPSRSSLYP